MDFVLSLVVLAAIALLVAAFLVWRRGGPRKQVFLMIVLALVALANVAIWTLPDAEGQSPATQLDGR